MTRILLTTLFLFTPLLMACESGGYRHMYLQGVIGANALGSDEVNYREIPSGYEGDPDTDLDTAPMLGFSGQQPFAGSKEANAGIEFGGNFTWWNNGVDVYGYAGGGGAVVILDWDNRMWMTDWFVGPYGSLMLGDKLRLYGGAGLVWAWADVSYDTEYETQGGQVYTYRGSESDWSWGWYGRAGVEFAVGRWDFAGIGIRYMETDFTFRDLDTKVDLGLWQLFATFTTKF